MASSASVKPGTPAVLGRSCCTIIVCTSTSFVIPLVTVLVVLPLLSGESEVNMAAAVTIPFLLHAMQHTVVSLRVLPLSLLSFSVGFWRAELWDLPEVREFFNLDAMDQGKSYAERAHAAIGSGLRFVLCLREEGGG